MILVDMMDCPVGTGEKGEVHAKGLLHRAFSLFLQDQEGRVLLQQRAMGKYHSGGLWTNSCCSHPAPGDSWEACIALRTQEELGVTVHGLREVGQFVYHRDFGDGVQEFELDHIWVGQIADAPKPDPEEAMALCWLTPEQAAEDLRLYPARYTAWYPTALSLALPVLTTWASRAQLGEEVDMSRDVRFG
ncbi:MAG: isopentenyl-diphosphate Delta-isomerase [Oscillospiraceae bacterium]